MKCASPPAAAEWESEADTEGPKPSGFVEMYSSVDLLWAGHKKHKKQDKYSIHKTEPWTPLPPLSDGGGRGWRPETFQLEVQSF